MSEKKSTASKLFITGTSIAIGFGLKALLKKGWEQKYDEPPPGAKVTEDIQWGKLLLWSFFTGLLLRLIKVMIKRSLSVAMERKNLLT